MMNTHVSFDIVLLIINQFFVVTQIKAIILYKIYKLYTIIRQGIR